MVALDSMEQEITSRFQPLVEVRRQRSRQGSLVALHGASRWLCVVCAAGARACQSVLHAGARERRRPAAAGEVACAAHHCAAGVLRRAVPLLSW
jgi:hypothetical protein